MCHCSKVLKFLLHHPDYHTYLTVSFQFITQHGLFSLANIDVERRGSALPCTKRSFTHLKFTITKTKSSQNHSATFELCRPTVQQRLWQSGTEKTKRRRLRLHHIRERGQKIFASGRSVDVKILRQQTCFWLWSCSLWPCLRATGTR